MTRVDEITGYEYTPQELPKQSHKGASQLVPLAVSAAVTTVKATPVCLQIDQNDQNCFEMINK
jgi:hypothetical protein